MFYLLNNFLYLFCWNFKYIIQFTNYKLKAFFFIIEKEAHFSLRVTIYEEKYMKTILDRNKFKITFSIKKIKIILFSALKCVIFY